ncbi:MAG: hypothetical protein OZ935_12515 [Pseudomonadota bacterium]|nr:hypothetical protein [Pseudomonadota bacterium]
MSEHGNRRDRGRDPVEEFIAGEGPLAAALREMPAFEPPAGMVADFHRMLASLPEAAAAFEPPARLEANVLAEIARQQAASSARRDAVLGELARGADPAQALDADLAPTTRAWLRERSREAADGNPSAGKHPSIDETGTPAAGRDGRGRYRWPAGWWRYAGGGLAAVLALGIGLRMMLEPPPVSESTGMPMEAEARKRAAAPARAMAPPPPAQPAPAPEARTSESTTENSLISREEAPTSSAIKDKAKAAGATTATGAMAGIQGSHSAPSWRLSDDPVTRLAGLPEGTRWVLLSHPSERAAAEEWLRRGLDAMAMDEAGTRRRDRLRESLRVEAREHVAAGSLQVVQDN